MLALFLLAACDGQSGQDSVLVARCVTVSDTPVTPLDTTLGFSAEDLVASLDGRAWDVAWADDDRDMYSASPIRSFTVRATPDASTPRVLELEDGDRGCDLAGTVLLVPAVLSLEDPDATFAASGPVELAAFSTHDADVHLYDSSTFALTEVRDDIASAAEDTHAGQGTLEPLTVSLDGSFVSLELSVNARSDEAASVVTYGTLSPE